MPENDPTARKTAVITGASSGLGKTYAEHLARDGYDLLLVARREPLLLELKEGLESSHGVEVDYRIVDLAEEDPTKALAAELAERRDIEMLVNNAGFGTEGFLSDADFELQIAMIQVHITAPMRLMRAVLPQMIERGRGVIVNVASVAGFLTGAGSVSYCASKAFLTSASQSLAAEVRPDGVQVQALCPGFVYTGFHDTPQMEHFERSQIPRFLWLDADDVVGASLRQLRRGGRAVCIPSLVYKTIVGVMRLPILPGVLRYFFEGRIDRREKSKRGM